MTDHARRLDLMALVAGGPAGPDTATLCRTCADVVGVTGAGIMLMAGQSPRGTICTTDDVSALIERLQFDLIEGPCVDAFRGGVPVSEPDLAAPAVHRWTVFSPPAVAAGARAVFGYPLGVAGTRLGALNLYCDQPGALTDAQHHDATLIADIAARTLLDMQSTAPRGTVSPELEASADFSYVVHQACGMVAAQMLTSVEQALLHLRAHAFARDRPLVDVARDVVGRHLRFEPGGATQPPTPFEPCSADRCT